MANLPFPTLRKRRTREHIIADLSINHVERIALLCGFSVERIQKDYGIDLFVHTYNRRGEVENGRILFQVKASDGTRRTRDEKHLHCRIEKADLLYWMGEREPVVLVHYDAKRDLAFWLHIQDNSPKARALTMDERGKKISLPIPYTNLLDRAALTEIARRKNSLIEKGR